MTSEPSEYTVLIDKKLSVYPVMIREDGPRTSVTVVTGTENLQPAPEPTPPQDPISGASLLVSGGSGAAGDGYGVLTRPAKGRMVSKLRRIYPPGTVLTMPSRSDPVMVLDYIHHKGEPWVKCAVLKQDNRGSGLALYKPSSMLYAEKIEAAPYAVRCQELLRRQRVENIIMEGVLTLREQRSAQTELPTIPSLSGKPDMRQALVSRLSGAVEELCRVPNTDMQVVRTAVVDLVAAFFADHSNHETLGLANDSHGYKAAPAAPKPPVARRNRVGRSDLIFKTPEEIVDLKQEGMELVQLVTARFMVAEWKRRLVQQGDAREVELSEIGCWVRQAKLHPVTVAYVRHDNAHSYSYAYRLSDVSAAMEQRPLRVGRSEPDPIGRTIEINGTQIRAVGSDEIARLFSLQRADIERLLRLFGIEPIKLSERAVGPSDIREKLYRLDEALKLTTVIDSPTGIRFPNRHDESGFKPAMTISSYLRNNPEEEREPFPLETHLASLQKRPVKISDLGVQYSKLFVNLHHGLHVHSVTTSEGEKLLVTDQKGNLLVSIRDTRISFGKVFWSEDLEVLKEGEVTES